MIKIRMLYSSFQIKKTLKFMLDMSLICCIYLIIPILFSNILTCKHNNFKKYCHLIIGGSYKGDPLSDLEFHSNFNSTIQTSMPPIRGHIGFVLNGTPMYCGGITSLLKKSSKCYKFDNKWIETSNLPVDMVYPFGVNVPGYGFVIFGYRHNILISTFVLTSPDSYWISGPPTHQQLSDGEPCIVQYNSTMTVFLGGIRSQYQIATYDWITHTYSIIDKHLSNGRWLSSCSLLRNKYGDLLVAVFGGSYATDLEAWDPIDNSVINLATLDYNKNKNSKYFEQLVSTQLVPINDFTELLMYGGYSNAYEYHNTIWKYSSNNNQWTNFSKMHTQKSSMSVLSVKNNLC